MSTITRLLLALALLLPLCTTTTTRAESPQRTLPCKASLVPWNCANLFSGSFDWQSSLTGGSGTVVNIQESVTVVIKAGVATCNGTKKGKITTEDTVTDINLSISGPGLAAVEFGVNTEDDPKGPYYNITIACPTPSGTETNTNRRTGVAETMTVTAKIPKGFDGEGQQSDKQPGSEKNTTLQGTRVDDHPDADPANGLSGKITLTWKLTRV